MSAARLRDAVGQARERHADVGGQRAAARPVGEHREVDVVPRLPEAAALLGLSSPTAKRAAAELGARSPRRARPARATPASEPWNSRNSVGARPARPGPRGVDGVRSAARPAARSARSGCPSWTIAMARVGCAAHASGTSTRAAATCSGMPWTRTDSSVMTASVPSEPTQQVRQVVAGARLAGAGAGVDDRAVGEHRLERRARSRGSCRSAPSSCRTRRVAAMPPMRGVGAGVDGEEEAVAPAAPRSGRPS